MEKKMDNSKQRILRLPEVKNITGLSRSSIYGMIRSGTFPSHIQLGTRCIGWLENKVSAWVEQRVQISLAARKQ